MSKHRFRLADLVTVRAPRREFEPGTLRPKSREGEDRLWMVTCLLPPSENGPCYEIRSIPAGVRRTAPEGLLAKSNQL